jgi:hypothetical protein
VCQDLYELSNAQTQQNQFLPRQGLATTARGDIVIMLSVATAKHKWSAPLLTDDKAADSKPSSNKKLIPFVKYFKFSNGSYSKQCKVRGSRRSGITCYPCPGQGFLDAEKFLCFEQVLNGAQLVKHEKATLHRKLVLLSVDHVCCLGFPFEGSGQLMANLGQSGHIKILYPLPRTLLKQLAT